MRQFSGKFFQRSIITLLLGLLGFINPLAPLAALAAEETAPPEASNSQNLSEIKTTSEPASADPKAADTPDASNPEKPDDPLPSAKPEDAQKSPEEVKDIVPLSNKKPLPQNLQASAPNIFLPFTTVANQAKAIKPEVDQSSGALTYSYNFELPPGKNGLTPNFSLDYNSQNSDPTSITGYGWSISIPTVKRLNLYGVNQLYNNNDFVSSISGELVAVAPNVFAPKTDHGEFIQYTLQNNSITAKTKDGTTFFYGSTGQAQHYDPNNASHIYEWYLEKVQDPQGNTILYTYTKLNNRIYPSTITYGGTANNPGIFQIVFTLEPAVVPTTSYRSGFLITTAQQIKDIAIKVNGTTTRTYQLSYISSPNNSRALLQKITETAGNQSKPPIIFNYQQHNVAWNNNGTYLAPTPLSDYLNTNFGFEITDINGDALPDLVQSTAGCCWSYTKNVFFNDGFNFVGNNNIPINMPLSFALMGSDDGVRIADINGDLLPDLLQGSHNAWGDHLNIHYGNGAGWNQNPSATMPDYFNVSGLDGGIRIADVNGDQLPDLIKSQGVNSLVWMNQGGSFVWDPNWQVPALTPTLASGIDVGTRFIDFNGDGLVDIVRYDFDGVQTQNYGYVNTGTGWAQGGVTSPLQFTNYVPFFGREDRAARIFDANGDGLEDVVQSVATVAPPGIMGLSYVSNAAGFQLTAGTVPTPFVDASYMQDLGTRIADVNGDGIQDIVNAYGSNSPPFFTPKTFIADSAIPDLLSSITVPTGGVTTVTYKPSAQYRDAQNNLLNPHLPMVIQTVESITETDPITSLTATTHYLYENGSYYYNGAFDRKFAGFEKVTTIRPDSSKIISYYHQGNTSNAAYGETADHSSKIGMMYRQDIVDSQGNLYTRQTTLYDYAALPSSSNNRFFVFKTQEMNEDFDGNQTSVATAASYLYDLTNGNLTQSTDYGDVTSSSLNQFSDIGSDKRYTTYAYATNGQGQYKLSFQTTYGTGNAIIGQEEFDYDNLAYGQLNGGLLTTHSRWIDMQQYQTEHFSYDSTGFMLTQTDPLNAVTTYTADAFKLYPVTIKNALNQTVQFTYDYSTGQPLTYTDQNGKIYTASYDQFGRITSYTVPLAGSPTKITRSYNDTPDLVNHLPVSVTTTNYLQANQSHKSYVLFDGFGRTVRTLEGDDTGANCYNADTTYDQLGNTNMSSLPYAGSCALTYTAVAAPASLKTTYSYDTLGRKLTEVNVLGTTTMQYDDRVTTITDPLNHTKKMGADALGRLVKVTEKLGNQNYDTLYSYDLNNNLTQITDALLNVRNFTYDLLGNRLTATDLHAPADSTFGTWTETYQLGMLKTSTTQPTGLVISYGYDSLHRLTSKTGGNGQVNETYVYDNCTNGTGKLCTVTSPTTTQTYAYDAIGRTTSESLTVNSQTFVTGYSYDYDGHPLTVIQPNGEVTTNTYTNRGLPLTVSHNGQSVVTNVIYNEIASPVTTTYANNTLTIRQYDASSRYRLINIKTYALQGQNQVFLEDNTYAYDAVGNMISDTEGSPNSPYVNIYTYDELDRMLSVKTTSGGSGPGGTGAGSQTVTRTYTYDILGNVLTSPAGNYTYGGNVGVGMYANPHGATQIGANKLRYDQNGNVNKVGSNIYNSTLYYYNYQNHVRSAYSVQNIGGMPVPMEVASYGYTPDGARVVKELSGGASTTIYPTKSYETDGTTTTIRLFLGSQEVGTVEKVGAGAATRRYIHPDNLGGSRVITDSAGNNAQTLYYQPFGEIRVNNKTGAYDEKRKYTGHLHDDETNLEYMEARYYNAQWGRFTSEDPLFLQIGASQESAKLLSDPQSLNSYAYARNNPLKYVDPDGRDWMEDTNNFFKTANDRVRQIGDLLTFGQFSNAFDAAQQVSNEWSTAYDQGNLDAAKILSGAGKVTTEGLKLSGVSLFNGMTLGEMYTAGKQFMKNVSSDQKILPEPDWIGGGNVPKSGEKISGAEVTKHAADQAQARGISTYQIDNALNNGVRYYDNKNKSDIWAIGERGNGGYSVVTTPNKQIIKTVQNFVPNLSAQGGKRFVKY